MQSTGRDVELLRALIDRVDQLDPGAFNNLGVLYNARGLHAEAVEAFLRALALDPRSRTASRNLEIAATHPGACDARIAALDALVAADPDDRNAALERARLSRLVGHTESAIRQLEALIANDPDNAAALFERGLIEQHAGDLRRAQRWFERAVNQEHEGIGARLHLAEVLYQRGQSEQALACLDLLLVQWSDCAEAHLLRGFVLGDMGQQEAALAAAQRAAQLNPGLAAVQSDLSLDVTTASAPHIPAGTAHALMRVDTEGALARYGLGLAFRQRGYFEEARREFERALAGGEDPRLAEHALAELDLIAGRFTDAQARYEVLVATFETPRLWNEHGVALHQGGKVIEAAMSYRKALRLDPRCALAYNNIGVALHDLGDIAAAREAFHRAATLDSTLIVARLNHARWQAEHADPLVALSILRELIAFHPKDVRARHAMGTTMQRLGRLTEAREALLAAVENGPTFAESRFVLADVLKQLGDHDAAAREAEHALRFASHRTSERMAVGIALQLECPEAAGSIDLLTVHGGVPLLGTAVAANTLDLLLPDQASARLHASGHRQSATNEERVARLCEDADAFALQSLHGEALDRYTQGRMLLDTTTSAVEPLPQRDELYVRSWFRSALGEARSLCALGRASEGLELLKRAGAASPQHPEVLALYAAATAALSDRDTQKAVVARDAMLRLLAQDVTSAALLHFVGDAALVLRDDGLAMAFYRRALALDPVRPSARVAIARLLRERGDLLAARLELVAALTVVPDWPEAVVELARVHMSAYRWADARWILADLLTRDPAHQSALLLLIEVLIEEDRPTDARVIVDRVLRHDPESSAAQWFQGVLLAQQSRVRAAYAHWSRLAESEDSDAYVERARRAITAAVDKAEWQQAAVPHDVAADMSVGVI